MVVLKSDYSCCPLKKRPLPYDVTGSEQTEPEDLSVKCSVDAPSSLPGPPTSAQLAAPTPHAPAAHPSQPSNRRSPPPVHPQVIPNCSCPTGGTTRPCDCPNGPCSAPGHLPPQPRPSVVVQPPEDVLPHALGHLTCHPSPSHSHMGVHGSPDSTPSAPPTRETSQGREDDAAPSLHPSPPHLPPAPTDKMAPSERGTRDESSVRPHRPWLSDDPPRQSVVASYPTLTRPQPVLATSNMWGGLLPFSWSLPHVLPPPPLPPRVPRECGSPGSESASSESSSGWGGEARYSCTDCSKSYSTYSGLSKHKQFHCTALGAKSFGCKHCDKVYTSLGALKMHIRTHTLPCKCQLCGKAFSRPWLLQGHIRTHTGEKPFQCNQCERCFADRSNLRAHLQTHAEVKKYACATCHKTFSRMSLLNKHQEAACAALRRI